jgi:hypothetical protein
VLLRGAWASELEPFPVVLFSPSCPCLSSPLFPQNWKWVPWETVTSSLRHQCQYEACRSGAAPRIIVINSCFCLQLVMGVGGVGKPKQN